MYKDNCFVRTGTYTARLKVFNKNTWDWLDVELRKTDVNYIQTHCHNRKECVPTLRRRGKNWYLDFAYEEEVKLETRAIREQIAIGVDLGINNECVCSAITSKGTVIGRKFLKLPREKDYLKHKLNKLKKAQREGAYRTPKIWSKAKGINTGIANRTAQFIADTALFYNADVVVFEHLELKGRKRGSKKQRLHHWKARSIQRIVSAKMYVPVIHRS